MTSPGSKVTHSTILDHPEHVHLEKNYGMAVLGQLDKIGTVLGQLFLVRFCALADDLCWFIMIGRYNVKRTCRLLARNDASYSKNEQSKQFSRNLSKPINLGWY